MNFEEVINTIENKRRFGKAYGRDVTLEFMKALDYPEKGLKVIHIAGTNGKGSVAAFVSSILRAASFYAIRDGKKPLKIGLFTSPHLVDFTERIIVDGKQISKEDATRIGEMLLATDVKLEPTMFDYCLAMAIIYFKEQQVDYAVIETGLGGSKDSTSGLSVIPEVSVITSIGLEHTAILGNTYEEIAGEKAGIIKTGTKAVIGKMPDSAREVIEKRCYEQKVQFFEPEPVADYVQLGLFGKYQRKNASLAVQTVKLLDIEISDECINKGLADARWPGRMEIISKNPFILIDGAHNPSGIKALYDSLTDAFKNEKFTFVVGVMADKDYASMMKILGEIAKRFFTVTVESSRALQADALAEELVKDGFEAVSCNNLSEAFSKAKAYNEKIIVCGSLYFIGSVLDEEKIELEF